MTIKILLATAILFCGCKSTHFHKKWAAEIAPASFKARVFTSKGNFDMQITRACSPKAVDRMYQLLKHHALDNVLFYRVVPDFVAQFGQTDTAINNLWEKTKIIDEPVRKSNKRGTISFARSGAQTRGTQLYINLKDNPRLDTIHGDRVVGFPAFGEVISGMQVVDALYSGYSNKVFSDFDSLSPNRIKFLQKYPQLDSIITTQILK